VRRIRREKKERFGDERKSIQGGGTTLENKTQNVISFIKAFCKLPPKIRFLA
jgi:hypothetical protein